MKRLARAAVLTTLRDELEERGSWVGETHLQKGMFILQVGAGVPLAYNFILYKHGPFAFDLREDLTAFRIDGLLRFQPQRHPYGPRLFTTPAGEQLQTKFPKTLSRYEESITAVADLVGARGVVDLERLGTALMMIKDFPEAKVPELSAKLKGVKPHVPEADAAAAIREIQKFLRSRRVSTHAS